MSESIAESYVRHWSAREYLRQYYSTPITADDAAGTSFAARELRALAMRFPSGLEFGCGPTAHHTLPFAPYVDEFTLADFMPDNLAEARLWLEESSDAFDWDLWLSGMLTLEAAATGAAIAALDERKARMRRMVTSLDHGDALREPPVGDGRLWDVVASYYCIECVGTTLVDWRACLERLCGLVRPGGVLFLGAVRRARFYSVFDQTFPVASVDEEDYARELPRLGFPAEHLRIQVDRVPEFEEQGFDSVCNVRAVKASAA